MLRRSFLRGCLSVAAGCVLSRLPLVGPRVEAVSLEGPYTVTIPEPPGGWKPGYWVSVWTDADGRGWIEGSDQVLAALPIPNPPLSTDDWSL